MEQVEVTYFRSFKLWWSFAWRGFVLALVIFLPIQIANMIFIVMPFVHAQASGQRPDFGQIASMTKMMLILWPIMMVVVIATQTLAMRWMLRTAKWSDFKLIIAQADKEPSRSE